MGRTNTCNKEGFSLKDLKEMLTLLKEDLEGEL
nr:MAG TPA: DNA binding protein [Caudoviricetes sp.]